MEAPPQMLSLRQVNPVAEGLRLFYGTCFRLAAVSAAYYGVRGAWSHYVRGNSEGFEQYARKGKIYASSMLTEVGVSVILSPARYLASVTAPRFMLDYASMATSDLISVFDRFDASHFASFAALLFSGESESDWGFDFFNWQIPSVLLTLVKVGLRWKRHGYKNVPLKKILAVLPIQIILRAFVSSFTVRIPEYDGEAVECLITILLESWVTAKLCTWSYPFLNEAELEKAEPSENSTEKK